MPALLAIALWTVIGVCCVLPLTWMIVQIVSNPGAFLELKLTGFRARLLGRTIGYNVIVAMLSTLMALPAALLIGRGRGWLARAMVFILPLPLLLPSITYAYGWSQALRLLNIFPQPASIGDVSRCIWTLATWLWAIPAVVIGLAWRQLDTNLQQQAQLDGVYWRITARQLIGPTLAAGCIVSLLAMQEFAVYEPTGISVMATEMRAVFDTGMMNLTPDQMVAVTSGMDGNGDYPHWDQPHRAAAAITTAMPLLIVIALFAGVAAHSIRRTSASGNLDPGIWPASLDAGLWARFGTGIMLLISLILPATCMLVSLKRQTDVHRIWETYSPQVIGSLLNATVSGTIGFAIGLVACARRAGRALVISLITFLIGGQLLAIAEIRLYNRPYLSWIYNASPVVVMAYLARFGWIALVAGQQTWSRTWRELRDMAALDGADSLATARHIIWPLALPMALAAGVLIAVLSLTEVPATVLLAPQKPPVLIPYLMTWVHTLRSDDMLEASLLLMLTASLLGALALGLIYFAQKIFQSKPQTRTLFIFLAVCGLALPSCTKKSEPQEIWLETGAGNGQVVYPRGITYSPSDDTFFVVDRMAHIQHFDHSGKFLNGWRLPDFAYGQPVGLSVGPDHNVYIPDTHYHRILVFTPQGQKLREFGSNGTQPGQFIYPTDIAFDEKGNLFVSEYGDHDRIQVFNPQGQFLYQFGKFGQGDGEFSRPQSILIDHGRVFLTDACNHRICVFKTDGTWVRNMGSLGSGPGEFRFPYGLDQDSDGNLIVCEFGNNRVQRIDKVTGRCTGLWGHGGREPGELAYPWGVIVDRKDRVIVVDSGNNRLQVFGF